MVLVSTYCFPFAFVKHLLLIDLSEHPKIVLLCSLTVVCKIVLLLETKPTFTVRLKDITVPEEQSVTLECELSKPDQKVKWFKDGKEIKPDKKRGIVLKVDGSKHTLTIPKTLKDDTTEYSVKCGDQETKGKLSVEGENVCFKSLTSSILY